MKGFEAWVAGPWSTLALVWAALAVGAVLGWGLALRPRGLSRGERRELADRAADRAARQFRRLREPERRTSTAAFLDPPAYDTSYDAAGWEDRIEEEAPPEPGWSRDPAAIMAWSSPRNGIWPVPELGWSEHVGQALAVANGDPITTGEIRAIAEDMDVWLERTLGQHPVPYPDGDQ